MSQSFDIHDSDIERFWIDFEKKLNCLDLGLNYSYSELDRVIYIVLQCENMCHK